MNKRVSLAGVAAMALLGAAACSEANGSMTTSVTDDSPVRVAARLDCPEREGDLRLQSAAADGRACAYRTEDGAEVELRLAAADALPALEAELKALIPAAAAPEPPTPPEPLGSGTHLGVANVGERSEVRLPGLKIDTQGDRASVRMPGVHIEADGENAQVKIGEGDGDDVNIRAHEGGAEVRVSDAENAGDVRSTFLITSDEPGPAGWRVAGYQARGSGAGRLVLGVLRARGERHNGLMDDMEDLLDRNVN